MHKVKVKNAQIRVMPVIKVVMLCCLLVSKLYAQEELLLLENSLNKKGGEGYIYFDLKSSNSKIPKSFGVTVFLMEGNKKYFLTMIFHKFRNNLSKDTFLKAGKNIITIDSLIVKIKIQGLNNVNSILSTLTPVRSTKEGFIQNSTMTKVVYSSICNNGISNNLVDKVIIFNFCDIRILQNKNFFREIPLETYAEETMGRIFQLEKKKYFSVFKITSFTFNSYSPEPKNTYYFPFISNLDEKYMINYYLGIIGFYGTNILGEEVRFYPKRINNKAWKIYLNKSSKL